MSTKRYCCVCEAEVELPKGTENMAKVLSVICEDCVEDVPGKRMGPVFEPEDPLDGKA